MPSRRLFNAEGRQWFFKLLLESIIGIFINVEFKHVWFTDQLTSFIGPMRDMEYTICYYRHLFDDSEEKSIQCSSHRPIVLYMGFLPHILRILQVSIYNNFKCIRIIYQTKKLIPQSLNILKYSMAILVTLISSYSRDPFYKSIWSIVAVISTFYSFFWDIKMDFGFLQPYSLNYPLRDKLSFKNKNFYYFSILMNLFLRFMWVLTVSPEVVYLFIRPEFLLFILYVTEVTRRCMWNFIRVELKHIELCKEFKVTVDIELPFKKVGDEYVLKSTNILDFINKRLHKLKILKESFRMTERGKIELNQEMGDSIRSMQLYESKHFRDHLNNFIKIYRRESKKILLNCREKEKSY